MFEYIQIYIVYESSDYMDTFNLKKN
jgi:hypothetical protein